MGQIAFVYTFYNVFISKHIAASTICDEEYKFTCKIKLRIGTNANFGFWEEFLSLNCISSDAVLAEVAMDCSHGFHAEECHAE